MADLEQLKSALVNIQNPNQICALIVDFTHEEIISIYYQLSSKQQQQILKVWTTEIKSG